MGNHHYRDIEAFYDDNRARRFSGEADYGVWWANGPGRWRWRVSYIEATGEVYAVNRDTEGPVEVLGIVPPDPHDPGEVYYATLESVLHGWAEGGPKDIAWARERIQAYWAGPMERAL